MKLTPEQVAEAVKLARVLATFPCENEDDDDTCVGLVRDRTEMCGPCHAWDFIEHLQGEDE